MSGRSSTRLRAQFIKEMLSITRDRRLRFILVVPPILQLLVFSLAITMELRNVNVGVYDQDGGMQAQRLYHALDESSLTNQLFYQKRMEPLRRQLDNGELLFVLVIPEHFTTDLAKGRPSELQVLFDGRRANSSQLAFAYVGNIVSQTFARRGAMAEPVGLRHAYNPTLNYRWYMVPGLSGLLMFLLTLLLTSLSIAREREMGTFEQMMVSPLTRGEIIVSKALPPLLVATLVGTLMLLVTIFVLGVPYRGELPLLAATMVCHALGGIGVGLMFSAVCHTQQQAVLSAFGVLVLSTLLSGLVTPSENMAPFMRWLGSLLPITHYLVITRGLFLKGPDAEGLWRELIPMLIFAASTLTFAVMILRRKLD